MGEGFMTGKGIFRDGSQIYDGEFTNKEGEPIFSDWKHNYENFSTH